MKKVIAFTLASTTLFATHTFADATVKIMPISAPISIEEISTALSDSLSQKYEVIIRNNKIIADDEYNNVHYFTKKIKTVDLVIPEEVTTKAKKIYFLVEEGSPIYYAKAVAMEADMTIDPVEKEYNYKVVSFTPGKIEYTFQSSDLVKDFSKNEYKNVTISLVAEFENNEKLILANAGYINIANKENILENLKSKNDESQSYFGYYDVASLETYLEKLGEKMARNDYKKVLQKADTQLKSLIGKNTQEKKKILDSITKESDFEWNVESYSLNSETGNLLSNVAGATRQQLQKLRSYELIDSIFNK